MLVQCSKEYLGLVFKSPKCARITPSSGKKLFCMCVTTEGGPSHFTRYRRLDTELLVAIITSEEVIGHLIKEHILPVSPFGCKLLDDPLRADAMLGTQLLPELKTN